MQIDQATLQEVLVDKYGITENLIIEGRFVSLIDEKADKLMNVGFSKEYMILADMVCNGTDIEYELQSLIPYTTMNITYHDPSMKIVVRREMRVDLILQLCSSVNKIEIWWKVTSIIDSLYQQADDVIDEVIMNKKYETSATVANVHTVEQIKREVQTQSTTDMSHTNTKIVTPRNSKSSSIRCSPLPLNDVILFVDMVISFKHAHGFREAINTVLRANQLNDKTPDLMIASTFQYRLASFNTIKYLSEIRTFQPNSVTSKFYMKTNTAVLLQCQQNSLHLHAILSLHAGLFQINTDFRSRRIKMLTVEINKSVCGARNSLHFGSEKVNLNLSQKTSLSGNSASLFTLPLSFVEYHSANGVISSNLEFDYDTFVSVPKANVVEIETKFVNTPSTDVAMYNQKMREDDIETVMRRADEKVKDISSANSILNGNSLKRNKIDGHEYVVEQLTDNHKKNKAEDVDISGDVTLVDTELDNTKYDQEMVDVDHDISNNTILGKVTFDDLWRSKEIKKPNSNFRRFVTFFRCIIPCIKKRKKT